MKHIFSKLSSACSNDLANYRREYVNNVRDIFLMLADHRILKSHIKTNEIKNAESLLRFSLVFNDLSLLTYTGGKELAMIWLQPKWFQKHFRSDGALVKVSQEKLDSLDIDPDNPAITPAFVFPSGQQINELAAELRPFIENGKLLIQPERSLFVLREDKNGHGGREWESINVSQFSTLEQWEIVEEQASRPIPLKYQTNDHLDHRDLFEITIPYLEGVSFKDLSKILNDEGDLISSLRSSIKTAMESCNQEADPKTVARDVVDPKVDLINRKFRSIVSSHAFRVAGAAVGTVVLAYTSITTSGLTSAIATVFGSGGIGLLGREYSSFKEKINTLKEDPHYFLWRCRKLRKKT